ncbi:PaaI family thioesterase [Kribbia dieselivorans]|uniref:PaaI family thioesterase n=1 Tax=Kribbia dieselivorans TaxID=331526 RepID=UPI00083961BD|nr:PaaI family thioesterase [Kribbia dieselivorans]
MSPDPLSPRFSPFADYLGMVSSDGRTIFVTPQPEHANYAGMAHGGFLMTLLDTATGRATRADLPADKYGVTTSFTTTFVRGAKIGEELRASAEVRHLGRQVLSVTADVHRVRDGALVAHAVSSMTVLDWADRPAGTR